jgi:hypothetical protein
MNTQLLSIKSQDICKITRNRLFDFAFTEIRQKTGLGHWVDHYIVIEDNDWVVEFNGSDISVDENEGRKRDYNPVKYDFGFSFKTGADSHRICFYSVKINVF